MISKRPFHAAPPAPPHPGRHAGAHGLDRPRCWGTRVKICISYTQGDVRKSRDAGIDDHMTKPVDPDRLLERIAQGHAGRES